jgi:hypothetical protein
MARSTAPPGGLDGFANACNFMGTERSTPDAPGERRVVHHHDITGRQGRHKELLDISKELCAVDRAIEDTRSGDSIVTQGSHERRRFPVTEGRMGKQPLAPFATPVAGRHVGRSPGLIDKYKPLRIKTFLPIAPSDAGS